MKVLTFSFVLLVALVTVSCGGGPSSQDSPTAQIRIMQASGDLGNVDVQFNGNTVASNLGWRQTFPAKATSYTSVQAGTVHYQEFATGTALPALVDTHFALSSNSYANTWCSFLASASKKLCGRHIDSFMSWALKR